MKWVYLVSSCAIAFILTGCSFVQLTDAGSEVAQASAADVTNCEDAGIVTSNTKSKVVVNRRRAKVQEELIVLARNRAAELGATAIVPEGDPNNGTQRFRAYTCN